MASVLEGVGRRMDPSPLICFRGFGLAYREKMASVTWSGYLSPCRSTFGVSNTTAISGKSVKFPLPAFHRGPWVIVFVRASDDWTRPEAEYDNLLSDMCNQFKQVYDIERADGTAHVKRGKIQDLSSSPGS